MSKLNGRYKNLEFNLLNTELFSKLLYDAIIINDFRTVSYLLLQTLPIKPTLHSDVINNFKTHAAIHELPYAYVLWLGSNYYAFKNRDTLRATISKLSPSNYNGVKLRDLKTNFSNEVDIFEDDLDKDYLDPSVEGNLKDYQKEFDEYRLFGYGIYNDYLSWLSRFFYDFDLYAEANGYTSKLFYSGYNRDIFKCIKTTDPSKLKTSEDTFALYSVKKYRYNTGSLQNFGVIRTKNQYFKYMVELKKQIKAIVDNDLQTQLEFVRNDLNNKFLDGNFKKLLIEDFGDINTNEIINIFTSIAEKESNNDEINKKFDNIDSIFVVNLLPSIVSKDNDFIQLVDKNPLGLELYKKEDLINYQFQFDWTSGLSSLNTTSDNYFNYTELNNILEDSQGVNLFYSRGDLDGTYNISDNMYSIGELLRSVPIHTLEACEEEFVNFSDDNYNRQKIDTYNFKSLLFALTTLTSDDFETIEFNGEKFNVEQQIDIINFPNKETAKLSDKYLSNIITKSIGTAQENKINKVINYFLNDTVQLKISNVLDNVSVDLNMAPFKDNIDNFLNQENTIQEYLNYFLDFSDEKYDGRDFNQDDFNIYVISNSEAELNDLDIIDTYIKVKDFFAVNGFQPTIERFKKMSDLIKYIIKKAINDNISVTLDYLSTEFETTILLLVQQYKRTANQYLNGFNITNVNKINDDIDSKLDKRSELGVAKFKTYYNIKDIFDRWISFNINDDVNFYNYDDIDYCEQKYNLLSSDKDLIEYFSFVDRANRDVSDKFVVNLKWLNEYLSDNLETTRDEVVNSTVYRMIDEISSRHNFVLHALPAFTNIGAFDLEDARAIFTTYDDLEEQETSPTFVLQYAGDLSSKLNIDTDNSVDNKRQSFCLDVKTNLDGNNVTEIPEDLTNGSAVAFVAEYGDPNQSFFKDLELDQSEFQNTEESYELITDLVDDRVTVASSNLYDFYTSRSYTASISTFGNISIQPLMYFYLKGVPMFYGSYWITNVTHSIKDNQMETRFQGVRQPIATLPLPEQITIESIDDFLSTLNINSDEYYEETVANPKSWSLKTRLSRSGDISYPIKYEDVIITNQNLDNRIPKQQKRGNQIYTAKEIQENLAYIIQNAYDPLIEYLENIIGEKINKSIITSAFRAVKVNEAVGGVDYSDHLIGAALDIDVDLLNNHLVSHQDVLDFFRSGRFKTNDEYQFNQLIDEGSLVHIAWKNPNVTKNSPNRGEANLEL